MTYVFSRSHRVLRVLLTVVAAGLVLAGCDSGPATDTADGVIAPVNPQVSFLVQPDSSGTDTLTLEYRGLSERPRPDTASVPDVYTVEVGEETGTPDNGTSTFLVTFTGPRQSGSYASPIRFRAGGVTATVRFAGTVIGPQTIADFENGVEGFFAFNGPGISQEEGQLRIDGSGIGGVGVFPGIAKPFSAPTNFEETPVVEIRMRVAASDTAVVRTALNGAGDNANANVTVPELVAEVPGNQGYNTYYFDFRGNFQQFDGVPVDPTQIGEIVLLINDNNPNTFTGTIYVDEIRRRPGIPEAAE
ncbi:MAG: hypothetical protein ABEL51_03300 [Salinibacter sp.]